MERDERSNERPHRLFRVGVPLDGSVSWLHAAEPLLVYYYNHTTDLSPIEHHVPVVLATKASSS